jgi:hypothetical protein
VTTRPGDPRAPIHADAAALAAAIQPQLMLVGDPGQAERLGRAVETSQDDETLLANVLGAVRVLLGELEGSGGGVVQP